MLFGVGRVGCLNQAGQLRRRTRVERALDAVELEQHLLDGVVDLLLAAVHAQDGEPGEMADHEHGGNQQGNAAEQGVDTSQLHREAGSGGTRRHVTR
ncbi:hypothetical protein D3C72_2010570 [compost metagenome]